MKLERRSFLKFAGAAALAPALPRMGFAQAYPARPVRVIIGFVPGSGADITTRVMADWLSERLGQQFFVDNRPGIGTNLAIEALVKAPADGYTFGLANVGNAIGATFYEPLSFDITRDIAPVAGIVRGPSVMVVNPSLPVTTVPEFIAHAKANPGKLNMASSGNGTMAHVAGELFKMMTGVDILHVPYRGTGPALADLFAGRVHVIFDSIVSSIDPIQAGKLRPLGVTTATRSPRLPDVPTIGESVPGFETSTWSGFGAPKGTPVELIEKLNLEINAGLADPRIRARFAELGSTVLAGSPADFGKLIAEETEKYARVVKFSGAKPS